MIKLDSYNREKQNNGTQALLQSESEAKFEAVRKELEQIARMENLEVPPLDSDKISSLYYQY